jgi:hypothetical protein
MFLTFIIDHAFSSLTKERYHNFMMHIKLFEEKAFAELLRRIPIRV